MAPDDVRRRVLVGRYPTREEADAVRQKLGPAFNDARVILGCAGTTARADSLRIAC